MKIGLLWFDDSGKDLEEKATRAARQYAKKHDGTLPDECHVHPSALSDKKDAAGADVKRLLVTVMDAEVAVISNPTVLRHHFWLGMEEASALGG